MKKHWEATNNFLRNLDPDKIEIRSWRKNLIPMELFLSFFIPDVASKLERVRNCSGSDTGWTERHGENNLIIRGGIYQNTEWLHNLQYKVKLDNPFNNYINPFYLFEIFNDDGKRFFIDYYSADIKKILDMADEKIQALEKTLHEAKEEKRTLFDFWRHLAPAITTINERPEIEKRLE